MHPEPKSRIALPTQPRLSLAARADRHRTMRRGAADLPPVAGVGPPSENACDDDTTIASPSGGRLVTYGCRHGRRCRTTAPVRPSRRSPSLALVYAPWGRSQMPRRFCWGLSSLATLSAETETTAKVFIAPPQPLCRLLMRARVGSGVLGHWGEQRPGAESGLAQTQSQPTGSLFVDDRWVE